GRRSESVEQSGDGLKYCLSSPTVLPGDVATCFDGATGCKNCSIGFAVGIGNGLSAKARVASVPGPPSSNASAPPSIGGRTSFPSWSRNAVPSAFIRYQWLLLTPRYFSMSFFSNVVRSENVCLPA